MTAQTRRELLEIVMNRKPGIPDRKDFHAARPPCPAPAPEPEAEDYADGRAIHGYFGLSYASYLVLPRSVLQSMPASWQARFVGLLGELGRAWDGPPDGTAYDVTMIREHDVTLVEDPYLEYDRGRRCVPLEGDDGTEYARAKDESMAAEAALRDAERRARVASIRLRRIGDALTAPLEKLFRERTKS